MSSCVATTICDVLCFLAHAEMDYLAAVNGLTSSTIEELSGIHFATYDASVLRTSATLAKAVVLGKGTTRSAVGHHYMDVRYRIIFFT